MTTNAAPQIPTRRKILYLVILVAFTLLALEGALRVRAWIKYGGTASVRDPMIAYNPEWDLNVPTPGYEVKGASIHIRINSLGFRGPEIQAAKPPRTVRIVCLGASTTFSAEVSSNEKTWTYRLQELLQAEYPDVRIEVVNAAVGGYVAADNLKSLIHRVLPLDPDLVLYYEANNEIVRDTRELAAARGLLEEGGNRSPIMRTLSNYSLMVDLLHKNLAILLRSRSTAPKIDVIPEDLPARFVGVLDEMRTRLAARGVPFVLSTFSVKYRRDQDRATQIANADVSFFYMPWMSIDGMLHAMDVYNQAILDYGARAGVPVIDDRFAIPPDALHFTDCMHLSDLGNEAMAQRFHRALHQSGIVAGLVRDASAR
jgi:lysophospholipase L1-like esterase